MFIHMSTSFATTVRPTKEGGDKLEMLADRMGWSKARAIEFLCDAFASELIQGRGTIRVPKHLTLDDYKFDDAA